MNLRVGFIFSQKKLKRSGFVDLPEYARDHGVDLVPVDLSLPLADQGRFDLIIHKLTDLMAAAKVGDERAKTQMDNFLSFIDSRPEIPIVDPLSNITKLLDRMSIYSFLEDWMRRDATENVAKSEDPLFHTPSFVVAESAKQALQRMRHFPVICKNISACSFELSHKMILVPTPAFFALDSPDHVKVDETLLLQEFINHDGIIFKVYVMDGHVFIMARPSLKNLKDEEGVKPVYFDSQKIPKTFVDPSDGHPATSKQDSDQWLSIFLTDVDKDLRARKEAELDRNRVTKIADGIGKTLGLTMFGFDVIVETGTGRHYVVDVNYFPGYANVPDFHRIFVDFLKARVRPHKTQ